MIHQPFHIQDVTVFVVKKPCDDFWSNTVQSSDLNSAPSDQMNFDKYFDTKQSEFFSSFLWAC